MSNLYGENSWLFSEPYPSDTLNSRLFEAKIYLQSRRISKPLVLVGLQTNAFAGVLNQLSQGKTCQQQLQK
jgi:hypothetical protein